MMVTDPPFACLPGRAARRRAAVHAYTG